MEGGVGRLGAMVSISQAVANECLYMGEREKWL